MAKRLLLALLALFCVSFAAPAAATTCDGYTVPTDVAAQPGWSCTGWQVVPQYDTTNSQHNPSIDPAVTPPPNVGLTNIASPSYTNRTIATTSIPEICDASAVSGGFCATAGVSCTSFGKLALEGGSSNCTEAKFRTHADFSHYAPDDPIRNFGAPGASHLHCFFANPTTNAYSTYKSLRKRALKSHAIGSDVNGTGYWYPCIIIKNRDGDGKNYVVKPDYFVVYYVQGVDTAFDLAEVRRHTALVPGLRYVFGYNMDDGGAWLQSIVSAANTANAAAGGSSTRYKMSDVAAADYPMQPRYICVGATNDPSVTHSDGVKYLKKPDGSDPYGGTCASGAQFWIALQGAECWDGKNLWSPGGYKHLIPRIYDTKYSEKVCPKNFYSVPGLTIEFQFTQYGWTDRQRWELSSDSGRRTAAGGTTTTMPDGFSFHTDWMHGWDQVQMLKWQQNCLGANNNTPHQCAVSQMAQAERLKGGTVAGGECGVVYCAPVDTTPMPRVLTTDPGWGKIPSSWTNSISGMHMHP